VFKTLVSRSHFSKFQELWRYALMRSMQQCLQHFFSHEDGWGKPQFFGLSHLSIHIFQLWWQWSAMNFVPYCQTSTHVFNGHFRILNWRYLPYIFGLSFRPKFQGISPENMAKHMVRLRSSNQSDPEITIQLLGNQMFGHLKISATNPNGQTLVEL